MNRRELLKLSAVGIGVAAATGCSNQPKLKPIGNPLLTGVTGSHNQSTKIFNVRKFGAVGDGVTKDTVSIQRAIDACTESGGVVLIPAGQFVIGTIEIKNNVTVSLDHGAQLLGSQDINDYPTDKISKASEGQSQCLLYAKNAINIRFEGLGVIDGRGTHIAFPRKRPGQRGDNRPRLFRFENCENLTFSGLTYKNPAFWGIHLVDCKNIHFNAITVRFRNNNYNNDGVDVDGCEKVLIENCDIDAGDDAICLKSSHHPCRNIVVRGCRLTSNTAALKLGASSRGGFIDLNVSNCYFYNCPMGAIKLELVDGGQMDNINISRIVMDDVGCPIFIRLGNRGNTFGKGGKAPVGTLKNITISDVVAKVIVEERAKRLTVYRNIKLDTTPYVTDEEKSKAGPIMISGIPGHYIENVVLENIKISFPGHGTTEDSKRLVPELENSYPEQFYFGVLPAWGAYIRHAKNIQFKDVELTLDGKDARQKIVLDDVQGFINERR